MAYNAPTETLTSRDIPNVGSANENFGSDTTLIVARPGNLCCSFPLFWFTVPEGFYALVTRHGAQEDYVDSDGNRTPVWPPGFHYGPPWLKVSHLVTKQSVVFNTPVRGCKTKDNVTVQIDIALVLRIMGDATREGDDPRNVYKFVHEVTALGLTQQLVDAQAEAVRTLARSVTHTEVFGLRTVSQSELGLVQGKLFGAGDDGGGFAGQQQQQQQQTGGGLSARSNRQKMPFASVFPSMAGSPPPTGAAEEKEFEDETPSERRRRTEEERDLVGEHDEYDPLEAGFNTETGASVTDAMKDRLNRQFMPQGVEILDVVIQQISLPEEIQKQMSQKTMVISQNAEQRMQQKHDMQVLSQTEAIKTLKQEIAERKMELFKDGEYEVLQENLKLSREKAEGQRTLADVNTQMIIDVETINAESALTVQRIRDLTTLEAEKVREEAEAEAAVMRVEAQSEVKEIEAKAELNCAELQAKGDKALFQAEGISAPKNRTLNDHTTSVLRLKAQSSLASNEKLVVTGTSGGKAANQLLLAEAALADAKATTGAGAVSGSERSALLSELAVASGQAKIRLHVGQGLGQAA